MKRPKPSTHEAAVEQRLPARRLVEDEPRREQQHHDREPADGLGLAVVSGRNTPSISSAMAPTTSTISGAISSA